MHKLSDCVKGWDIDSSGEFDNRQESIQVQKVIKTQPNDHNKLLIKTPQISPKKALPSINLTSPLQGSIKRKLISEYLRGKLDKIENIQNIEEIERKVEKISQEKKLLNGSPKVLQPIAVAKLRIKLNSLPKHQETKKAYTQIQLQAMMQLKRKNLYLKSVLRKVCHESDQRYSNHQKQSEIYLGYRGCEDSDQYIHKLQSPSLSQSRKISNRKK